MSILQSSYFVVAVFIRPSRAVIVINREAGGQGEFSVGLAARRDVAAQPAT
jgi:hypothetical protein